MEVSQGICRSRASSVFIWSRAVVARWWCLCKVQDLIYGVRSPTTLFRGHTVHGRGGLLGYLAKNRQCNITTSFPQRARWAKRRGGV